MMSRYDARKKFEEAIEQFEIPDNEVLKALSGCRDIMPRTTGQSVHEMTSGGPVPLYDDRGPNTFSQAVYRLRNLRKWEAVRAAAVGEHMKEMGAKGGKAAAQKMTAAQRSERARKAVAAREARKGEK